MLLTKEGIDGMRRWIGIATFSLLMSISVQALSLEFPNTPDDFIKLLREEQFDTLDNALNILQKSYESDTNEESRVLTDFMSFGRANPDLESHFIHWVENKPSSYAAKLARGIYYHQLGWAMRGSAYANKTAPRRFQNMQHCFDKAVEDLEASLTLTAKPVFSYSFLIAIAMAEGDRKEENRLLDHAVELDLENLSARRQFMQALNPQWGGSYEYMNAFLRHTRDYPVSAKMQKVLATLEGDIYARHAADLFWDGDYNGALAGHQRAAALIDDGDFLRLTGNDYRNLQQYDLAIADLNKALVLNPNDTYARHILAYSYLQTKQFEQSIEQLKIAADYGNTSAQFELGSAFEFGKNGLKKDMQQAMYWYRRAAELGDVDAQFNLGSNFMHGNGIPQNDVEAVKWLSYAAEQGDAQAKNNLGLLQWYGRGGLQIDPFAAIKLWYESTREGGGETSLHNIWYFMSQIPSLMIALGVTLISLILLIGFSIRGLRKLWLVRKSRLTAQGVVATNGID